MKDEELAQWLEEEDCKLRFHTKRSRWLLLAREIQKKQAEQLTKYAELTWVDTEHNDFRISWEKYWQIVNAIKSHFLKEEGEGKK